MTPSDNSPPQWMSSAEAASYLGITIRTLYRFIDQRELPAYRFGRVIRLKQHDVEAFIESSRIAPGELEHLYPEPGSKSDAASAIDESANEIIDVTDEGRTSA